MKQKIIAARETCRICGKKNLLPILSLGNQYVVDFPPKNAEWQNTEKFPLELVLCNKNQGGCGLLQLKHTISHEAMYRNYWYRSGVSNTMTNELLGIAKEAEQLSGLKPGDYVLDIGSNDSTLLRSYQVKGLKTVGFEPARNLAKYAEGGVTKVFYDFFNYEAWGKELGAVQAKVITAIAMFYDLEDPNGFVADVAKILDPEGLFLIQMNALPSMLEQNAFDNISHEHLEYYSLLSLEYLLAKHNLEVFDVKLNNINGGSFKTYIRHKGKGKKFESVPGAKERLQALREKESSMRLQDSKVYEDFASRLAKLRSEIVGFIEKELARGKKIYIYGASTRGNTLLQYYGLDHRHITAAAERNPDKWGRKIIGTEIPIISEEQARAEKPDYFLILPWAFLEEFTKREANFLRSGGKFIVPLPEFKIITE